MASIAEPQLIAAFKEQKVSPCDPRSMTVPDRSRKPAPDCLDMPALPAQHHAASGTD